MRVLASVTAILASAVALPTSDEYSGSRTVCPSFLMNCECTTVLSGVLVSCKNFTERTQLRSTMRDLRGFTLQQFTMTNSRISIENGDFADVSLYNMDVDSSSFEVMSVNDGFLLDSANKLRVLKFQNSQVDFGGAGLRNTKLSTLWFNKCEFNGYNPAWFDGLSVAWLRITNSPKLNIAIASKLQDLEKYSHTASDLTKLERSMLPENSHSIRELDFSANNIITLTDDFLNGLDGLERLDLSNNKLTTLSERAFIDFHANLYLSNNPLVCDNSLLWLAKRLEDRTLIPPHRYTCINEQGRSRNIRDLMNTRLTMEEDLDLFAPEESNHERGFILRARRQRQIRPRRN